MPLTNEKIEAIRKNREHEEYVIGVDQGSEDQACFVKGVRHSDGTITLSEIKYILNNPMPQKYPEGAIIETHGLRAKIIGRAGEVCFGQIIKGIIQSDAEIFYKSVELLESEGWTVEETPWVPKLGDKCFCVEANCEVGSFVWTEHTHTDIGLYSVGNCYRTKELAEAAIPRVKAAYKGEK